MVSAYLGRHSIFGRLVKFKRQLDSMVVVTSSCQPVLVIRPRSVVQDRVKLGQIFGVWIEPGVDVLRLATSPRIGVDDLW